MLRSMFQINVQHSVEAVKLYQKAFDAKIISEHKHDDGSYLHCELDIFGQIVAVSQIFPAGTEIITGTTMQLCLHFGKGNEAIVKKAYEILKDGAKINFPLGECFFSPLMFGLIDKFGVNWCVFI